jgi:O-antigen/teichoic acid export membrane protein
MANGLLYLTPTVVGNLVPLVTLPIFTRILPPDEYGAWALCLAYAAFVTGLANFGLTICYDRSFFEHRSGPGAGELLYSILVFVAAAYTLCAGVTWVFREEISRSLLGAARGELLFWVVAATGMSSLKWYYLAYLKNTGDARSYVWFTLDETILTAVLGLMLVAYFRVGVIGLPWAQFTAAAAVFVLATVRFVRTVPPGFSARLLGSSLRLASPLTPRIFLGVLSNNLDKYLLGLLATVGSVGVYSIGQKVAYLVFAYMTALENVFGPETYRRMFDLGEAGGREVGRYLTPFAYASFGVALVVSLFAEEALILLADPAYHGAVPVVGLLTLYYAIMFFGKQPQLMYAKKTSVLSVLTFVSLGAAVVCTTVGVRLFGALGAALGTLAAGTISVAVYNLVARRYYRIEWELGRLSVALGLLVGFTLVALLLDLTGTAYSVRLVVKLVGLLAYAVAGVALGILTRANLQMAWAAMRGRRDATADLSASA